ncbi:MAG: hypothetical protein DRI79_02480 [Chloroflexi bacterium]|nr:MAG: hypothetical protein DRI79_02480 [Chloroflexota bacterium]
MGVTSTGTSTVRSTGTSTVSFTGTSTVTVTVCGAQAASRPITMAPSISKLAYFFIAKLLLVS